MVHNEVMLKHRKPADDPKKAKARAKGAKKAGGATVVNVHEAKTHLSTYLNRLKPGERIVICRRNVPIAELRPIEPHAAEPSAKSLEPRPIGLGKGDFEISPAFFEDLPEDELRLYEGYEE
jgi:antitoxin (DNA-binding transcriptional repressor) of toxin-antitoxin stability system